MSGTLAGLAAALLLALPGGPPGPADTREIEALFASLVERQLEIHTLQGKVRDGHRKLRLLSQRAGTLKRESESAPPASGELAALLAEMRARAASEAETRETLRDLRAKQHRGRRALAEAIRKIPDRDERRRVAAELKKRFDAARTSWRAEKEPAATALRRAQRLLGRIDPASRDHDYLVSLSARLDELVAALDREAARLAGGYADDPVAGNGEGASEEEYKVTRARLLDARERAAAILASPAGGTPDDD